MAHTDTMFLHQLLTFHTLHAHSAGSSDTASSASTALSAKDFTYRHCKHFSLRCLFQRLHTFAQQQLHAGAISEILCPQLDSQPEDHSEETDAGDAGVRGGDWFDDLCGPEEEEEDEETQEVALEGEARQQKKRTMKNKKKASVVIREGLSVALVLSASSSSSVSATQEVCQEVDELAPLSLHFVY